MLNELGKRLRYSLSRRLATTQSRSGRSCPYRELNSRRAASDGRYTNGIPGIWGSSVSTVTRLPAGKSRNLSLIAGGGRYFSVLPSSQNGSGSQLISCGMGAGCLSPRIKGPEREYYRCNLVPMLRMCETILLFPFTSAWRGD